MIVKLDILSIAELSEEYFMIADACNSETTQGLIRKKKKNRKLFVWASVESSILFISRKLSKNDD